MYICRRENDRLLRRQQESIRSSSRTLAGTGKPKLVITEAKTLNFGTVQDLR